MSYDLLNADALDYVFCGDGWPFNKIILSIGKVPWLNRF